MKTNNIIEKIKEEFQGKSIQPSENAWEKMSTMLDAQEEEKPKKKIAFWMYAAAFAGLLIGITVLFQNENQQNDSFDSVVIENPKTDILDTKHTDETQLVKEKEAEIVKTDVQKVEKVINKSINKQQKRNKSIHKQQTTYAQTTPMRTTEEDQIVLSVNQELVVEKTNIKKEKKPLMQSSSSDIDAMLASAIDNEKSNNTYTLEIAENTLQKTSATKGDMTVNKFLKNAIQTGVDTVEDIITANDN